VAIIGVLGLPYLLGDLPSGRESFPTQKKGAHAGGKQGLPVGVEAYHDNETAWLERPREILAGKTKALGPEREGSFRSAAIATPSQRLKIPPIHPVRTSSVVCSPYAGL